jgi:hypothetical protein
MSDDATDIFQRTVNTYVSLLEFEVKNMPVLSKPFYLVCPRGCLIFFKPGIET